MRKLPQRQKFISSVSSIVLLCYFESKYHQVLYHLIYVPTPVSCGYWMKGRGHGYKRPTSFSFEECVNHSLILWWEVGSFRMGSEYSCCPSTSWGTKRRGLSIWLLSFLDASLPRFCLTKSPQGRLQTRWRHYVSRLAWEYLEKSWMLCPGRRKPGSFWLGYCPQSPPPKKSVK